MKKIKNILVLLILLLSAFVGLWIAQDNADPVAVVILGFTLPAMSLGMWLLVMFLGGVFLGLLASMPLIVRTKSENRRLKRK